MLTIDLSNERWARDMVRVREFDVAPTREISGFADLPPLCMPEYDYEVLGKIRAFRELLHERIFEKQRASSLRMNLTTFRATERLYESELRRLDRLILKLFAQRRTEQADLKAELDLDGTGLEGRNDPRHPYATYDDQRLTRRGAEICYRLYDLGKSPLAVAHLFGISLKSARRRKSQWTAVGGENRPSVDLDQLPVRKFYRRYDD